ncbi:hypothetical protein BKA62DRAFT_644194 [Auriculariales sp. MPI-PUGE-AT-0066]|nr:hypothetical protein BKA62DRAFT_644194 [Auriculariales sp. MPI-PUGE-AT-0066]
MFGSLSTSLRSARGSLSERVNSLRKRGSTSSNSETTTSRDVGGGDETLVPTTTTSEPQKLDNVPAYAYDVSIRFIGASGLPALDFGGKSDPYIVANVDDKLQFKSAVQIATLNPVFNELWNIKNVPDTTTLQVQVYDKDNAGKDDFIGQFRTSLREGSQEHRLDHNGAQRGTLWLEVKLVSTRVPDSPQYTFDGPVSFSRHSSATIGQLAGSKGSGLEGKAAFAAALPITATNNEPSPLPSESAKPPPQSSVERVRGQSYGTWKIHLKGVPLFFKDTHQHWLESYVNAQKIFQGPVMIRMSIRTAHRLLYARTTMNDFGAINSADDLWRQLAPQDRALLDKELSTNPTAATASDSGSSKRDASPSSSSSSSSSNNNSKRAWLVKPALYTYIIGSDDRFRFSETGAAFFTDFASKHALHSCVSETVRYAGEFHARPIVNGVGGWAALEGKLPPDDCEWELWIDNASGTYGPDPGLLPQLKQTIEYNFPGIKVEAWDFKNEELQKSKADMLAYANSKPIMTHTPSQLADEVQQLQLNTAAPAPLEATA